MPEEIPAKPAGGNEGGANASDVKTVLEQALGKTFPDEATALQSVKDTFGAVTNAATAQNAVKAVADARGISIDEAVAYIKANANLPKPASDTTPVDPTKFVSRDEFDSATFFASNKQYDTPEYRELIATYQAANPGKPLAEVVQLPSFKSVFEKATKSDEIERSRSVLHSNPRLAQAQDKVTESQQQRAAGNQPQAAKTAVAAVLDTLSEQEK